MPADRRSSRSSGSARGRSRPPAARRTPRTTPRTTPGGTARTTRRTTPPTPPRGTPRTTPGAAPWRSPLERASYPLLLRLNALPKPLVFLGLLAVLVGGAFAPAPFGPLLWLLGALFVGWLLVLSWPRLNTQARLVRSAVVLIAVAIVVVELRAWMS